MVRDKDRWCTPETIVCPLLAESKSILFELITDLFRITMNSCANSFNAHNVLNSFKALSFYSRVVLHRKKATKWLSMQIV